MKLFNEVVKELESNKKKRESGEIIAIPFPFKRFSQYVPGIQKGRYIICTANAKVGKTKFTDYMFMYGPLDYIFDLLEKKEKFGIDIKINYFSLEMSKLDKIKEAISYYLYTRKDIVMPPDRMESIFNDYILTDEGLLHIKGLEEIFNFFEERVTFHDNIRNPFGIYKEIRKNAHENGYYVDENNNRLDTKKIERVDEEEISKIFLYRQIDEDIYYIDIIDHYSLFTPERTHQSSNDPLRQAIKEFSSRYALMIRDRWRHTVVGIQQQANAQESTENYKLKKLRPSGAGLADCKDTQRDVDMMLGLFAPHRHDIPEWNGYNIDRLGDYYRELSIVLGRRGNAVATNLWFNGASNYFRELPKPEDGLNIEKVYTLTNKIKKGKLNG